MRLVIEYVQQFRRFQRNARLFLISNVLSGVTGGILLVLYNLYLVSLGYRADFIGVILFIGTIGAGLAIFPAGACIDRFSGKYILIYSTALIGIAGAGQILFRQPLPLLISAFLAGIGLAFLLVITAPFLTANSTPEERPHLFSMNISLGLITLVVGEVFGGALPAWFRSLPWFMAPLPPSASSLLASQPDPRSYQLALLFAGVIAAPSFIPLFMMSNIHPPRRTPPTAPLPSTKNLNNETPVYSKGVPLRSPLGRWSLLRIGDSISRTISTINALLHSAFFYLVLVYLFTGLHSCHSQHCSTFFARARWTCQQASSRSSPWKRCQRSTEGWQIAVTNLHSRFPGRSLPRSEGCLSSISAIHPFFSWAHTFTF